MKFYAPVTSPITELIETRIPGSAPRRVNLATTISEVSEPFITTLDMYWFVYALYVAYWSFGTDWAAKTLSTTANQALWRTPNPCAQWLFCASTWASPRWRKSSGRCPYPVLTRLCLKSYCWVLGSVTVVAFRGIFSTMFYVVLLV